MIKAIIFDMDGVIADTEPLHFEAAGEILKRHGKEFTKGMHDKYMGTTEKFAWSHIIKRFNIPENYKKVMEEKSEFYLQMLKTRLKSFPGVIDLIKNLQKEYKIAIASSSPVVEINTIIEALKIKDLFDVIVSGDNIKNSKPDPEIYLKAALKLKVSPISCLAIEDAVNGVKSAKAAGMKCVAVTNSFSADKLKEADYVVDSLEKFDGKWLQ